MIANSESVTLNSESPAGSYLLLIEDEPQVQEKNKRILERSGYTLRQAFTIAQAWEIINQKPPAAIILDIGLPDGNGLVFLYELRETMSIPVLILTAMGTSADIIRGFEAGGDDYLPKPYDLQIFLLRVEALMRRARLVPETITFGPITLNTISSAAFVNDEDLLLSKKEYLLLQLLVQHHEKIVTTDTIFEKVWGSEVPENYDTLKSIISRIRKKLENTGYTIVSERGEGYILERE